MYTMVPVVRQKGVKYFTRRDGIVNNNFMTYLWPSLSMKELRKLVGIVQSRKPEFS